ncbi:hypothetical protein [Pectobacterium carotovorum]|uniref:hypothetical protein n=1 Tax=Pectobacterium carotovorum TaxID=554 RepID=UPI001CF380AA|nr:hypothetical protein [Pectobacterium carotovorum]MCQ8231099.1 hypothetical protein [Pectobacterium carotovorum]
MHIFNDPSESQKYSELIHCAANNLLDAFKGGDTRIALEILDWMKDAVIANSSVIATKDANCVTASSPSFPLKVISIKRG